MAELTATQRPNLPARLLGQFVDLLRSEAAQPEFLPVQPMTALMPLESMEKLSYGDPLFRIPQQSNIPITVDRQYLMDALGLASMAPSASRATTKLSNEAADRLVRMITRNEQATAPAVLEAAGEMLPLSRVYRPTTPLKPDPSVGTRFEREFTGGLAEKTPVNIEDLQGSSVMIMPWDSTSRNYRVTSVSDEVLPSPIVTHGGQDYARDLAHIEQGVGGASNLEIAKRIRDRDTQARIENLKAGGTGQIIHLPTTMGEGAENFSVMPTEVMLGLLDKSNPSKKLIKQLDKEIREFKVFKGTGEKRVATQPFKNFKGVMTEEGRMQLYTGEGLGSTAGELRKAFVNRMSMKKNQEEIGFNAEDVSAALTDPALAGIGKGYVGNTVIATGEGGMHLVPAVNPTYSTNFTGQYLGTLGENVPVETLFPRLFPQLMQEFAGKKGDIRNMALGALEKRKQGVSELIDQQVIDNYYNYLNEQRALGLLD